MALRRGYILEKIVKGFTATPLQGPVQNQLLAQRNRFEKELLPHIGHIGRVLDDLLDLLHIDSGNDPLNGSFQRRDRGLEKVRTVDPLAIIGIDRERIEALILKLRIVGKKLPAPFVREQRMKG